MSFCLNSHTFCSAAVQRLASTASSQARGSGWRLPAVPNRLASRASQILILKDIQSKLLQAYLQMPQKIDSEQCLYHIATTTQVKKNLHLTEAWKLWACDGGNLLLSHIEASQQAIHLLQQHLFASWLCPGLVLWWQEAGQSAEGEGQHSRGFVFLTLFQCGLKLYLQGGAPAVMRGASDTNTASHNTCTAYIRNGKIFKLKGKTYHEEMYEYLVFPSYPRRHEMGSKI